MRGWCLKLCGGSLEGDREKARRKALTLLTGGTISPMDLWIAFYGIGGTADTLELEAYVYGPHPGECHDAQLLPEALLTLTEHS